jgi:3-oxoacyl-[acyl-carrier protein] reductase
MAAEKEFQNKVVIITGATRGIGKVTAEEFAGQGAQVMMIAREASRLVKAVEAIRKTGGRAEGFVCDVSDGKNVKETVNKILDKYKAVDILINNAGITRDNVVPRMSDEDWNTVLAINLHGVFHFTRAVSRAMLKARRGKIINISSIIGITGNAGQVNYAASKAGVIGFTKSVAREMASRGITANVVAPGYIQTEMTDHLKESLREALLTKIPLGRLGTPKDVAGVCLFLASSRADYMTGQTLIVDGGMAV